MPIFQKIDHNGNYTQFRGFTVVAGIRNPIDDINAPWQAIFNGIKSSKLLSSYYAPLPFQSYHMTTCDLFTEQDCYPNWLEFITKNFAFLQRLRARLKEKEFIPEIAITLVSVSNVLQLILTLPDNQNSLITSVANEFGVKGAVPLDFHITLAYGYRELEKETSYQDIEVALEAIINPYKNKIMTLSAPTLCYFHDMKQFIPWDGESNPFNDSKHQPSAGIFFNALKPSVSSKQEKLKTCLLL